MGSYAERIQMVSIQLVPFILAVVFHEFAHGFIAYRWGDHTAKDQGRLTLNPIPHLDPIGTVLFPLINMVSGVHFLFGWAKPVPINPNRFKKYRHGLFWVSIAGPLMNFILALISTVLVFAILTWVPNTFYLYEPLIKMATISVSLNYTLGIFNLIPLPPLDGSKIIQAFMPFEMARKYESIARYSFLILIGLFIMPSVIQTRAMAILSFPIHFFTESTILVVGHLFGVEGF